MASVETVETLELEIRTKANKAADEIARLASSVSDFGKEVGRHVSNLNDFAGSLERIVNAMKEMSSIKNLKNVIMSVAAVADTAKGKVTTPAVQQAVAAAKNGAWLIKGGATTIKGGTRYYQAADGSTRKYNTSARDLAKSLAKSYEQPGSSKDIAQRIADIRNMQISGKGDPFNEAYELAKEIASNAGIGRVSPGVKAINEAYAATGQGYTRLVADSASLGMSLKEANAILRDAGASFRFTGRKKGTGSADMIDTNPADLVKAVQDAQQGFIGHEDFLSKDERFLGKEEELIDHIYASLLKGIFGDEAVKKEGPTETVKEAVTEAATKATEEGVKELFKTEARTGSTGGGLKQFNPETGEFESTGHSSIAEWISSSEANAAQTKAEVEAWALSRLREEFAGSSDEVKTRVAANQGMTLEEMFPKMEELKEETEELGESAGRSIPLVNDLKESFKGLAEMAKSGAIANLAGQLWRVAKMRMLRYIVKQVAAGIKEGADNLYQWSKATNGHFASSLDTAATKLMLIKNSLITAVAPAIEAVIPLLGQLAQVVNTVSNYFAQFLALITGKSSWTKATETAQEWAAATKTGAKAADKEIKDLLADWDELNIIQGESTDSGSGGSGKKATDTSGMFEEVYTFDENIRKLMDNINEVFGDALGLVKEIAVVMAAWKLSAAASGALATLASVIALGGLIKLNFDISTVLSKQFFDTGDEGWLIADVLTDVVGGVLATKLALQIADGTYAFAAVPVMLLVGVFARTMTMLKRGDVSALSQEALEANAISALETGAAAGYIAWAAGASTAKIIRGTGAVSLITFGVLTGLKADVKAVRNAELDGEYIAGKALSSLAMSAGAATAAKLLVPGISMGQALGFGLASGTAATLFSVGATLGIVAAEMVAEEGHITEAAIVESAYSSVAMGLASTLAFKMGAFAVHGLGWGISAVGGASAALFTFGAELGIMAAIEAVENKKITAKTIVDEAEASLMMGGAIGITAGVIYGVSAGAAALIGGGFALAAFGVAIAITAYLSRPKENGIKWGANKLTAEQIEAYVNQETFTVNVPATIQLIKGKLEPISDDAWKQIEADAAAMTSTLNVIKLGCASEDTYNNLRVALFGYDGEHGVVGSIKQYAKDQKSALELGFSLVPMRNENGEVDKSATSNLLNKGQLGWDQVYKDMEDIGNKLGEALKAGTDASLADYDEKTILELTEKVENIKRALQYSDTVGSAENDLVAGLTGMDKPTWKGVIDLYDKYKNELTKSYMELEKSKADSYFRLASYYDYLGDEKNASLYRNMGKEIVEKMDENVAAAVKDASTPGVKALREQLITMLSGTLGFDDVDVLKIGSKTWQNFMHTLFNPDGINKEDIKVETRSVLGEIIKEAFPDDYDFIQQAIDDGILQYGDIITGEGIAKLLMSFGVTGTQNPDAVKWFKDYLEKELGLKPAVVETAKEVKEEVKETVKETIPDAVEEGVKEAVEEVTGNNETNAEIPVVLTTRPYADTDTSDWSLNPKAQAAEAYWDVAKLNNDKSQEWLDAEEAAFNIIADLFGDDVEALTALVDELVSNGETDLEDLPQDALQKILGNSEPITIDTAASGAASDSMLQNISTIVTTNMGDIQTTAQTMLRVLNWIAESSAETANKDMTVVISPSAALDKVNKRSARSGSKVTGVLALED